MDLCPDRTWNCLARHTRSMANSLNSIKILLYPLKRPIPWRFRCHLEHLLMDDLQIMVIFMSLALLAWTLFNLTPGIVYIWLGWRRRDVRAVLAEAPHLAYSSATQSFQDSIEHDTSAWLEREDVGSHRRTNLTSDRLRDMRAPGDETANGRRPKSQTPSAEVNRISTGHDVVVEVGEEISQSW